jgi:hypothetical protein
MGIKGFIRSVQAAQHRAEREAIRRHRELERRQREYSKMQEQAQAAYEVECYENKIDLLLSVHKDCGNFWNWEKIKNSKPPAKPPKNNQKETIARLKFDEFTPGILMRLFKRVEAKRNQLKKAIETAKETDEKDYRNSLAQYEQKYNDWKESQNLAEKIIAGETQAYNQAIKEINPFSEISQLGSSVSFTIINSSIIEANLKPNSAKVIPLEVKSLLKSGKLSLKKMPTAQFHELYQDYVCGCILRVSRELFALLPIKMVIIHALGNILNSQTGHMEEKPILSAAIPRETLEMLNFEKLDPSDSMSNFVNTMNFNKKKGFDAVEKLNPINFNK